MRRPFQLIWTPLAWHALITGLCVIGLSRYGVHWALWRQVAGLVALGLFTGFFALFWPQERGQMPDGGVVFLYIVGMAPLVPLANLGLDRIGTLARPSGRILAIAPALMAVLWAAQTVASLNPLRLSVPLLIALTVWTMRRLGRQGTDGLALGPPAPVWRHLMFGLAPLVSCGLSVLLWPSAGGVPANIIVAVITCAASLWLLFRLTVLAR